MILISSFISFLILFKNLRNKIAHCDIIYNFWDIYTPICNNNQRRAKSKKKDFWLLNKDSCIFLNNILNNKKKRFLSNYFLSFENKSIDYYLDKLNSRSVVNSQNSVLYCFSIHTCPVSGRRPVWRRGACVQGSRCLAGWAGTQVAHLTL